METDAIPLALENESFSETNLCNECYTSESLDDFNEKYEDYNTKLESRLSSLKNLMEDLKGQLNTEKELWKNEVEEIKKMVAPPERKCCECEEDISSRNSEVSSMIDYPILDYEQKLSLYHEALMRAHAEKKIHLRRHLAANAYRRKLLEVENMCNLELMKVKQSVQFLQPLQAMASEWSNNKTATEPEECIKNFDDELTGGPKLNKLEEKKNLAHAIEDFGNKMNVEMNEIVSRLPETKSSVDISIHLQEEEERLSTPNLRNSGCYWCAESQ